MRNLIVKFLMYIIEDYKKRRNESKFHVGISGTSVWVDHDEVMKKVNEDKAYIRKLKSEGKWP